jgi:SAM-dependent methyltransferase
MFDLQAKLTAFQESRVLLSAIELDAFTAVGEGATAPVVAQRLGTDPRATEMLLNALVAVEALEKSGDTFRNLAELAPHLVAGGENYARPALLHTANLWKTWSSLTDCVRAGTSVAAPGVEGRDQAWTESFIAAMHRNAQGAAERVARSVGLSGVTRMLDVGGGSGAYAIAFARLEPGLRAVVLDLPFVIPIAAKHIEAAGLAGRVTTRPGDLRKDEFGAGYDLILLSAICHMLGAQENGDLIGRCARALAPSGRLVVRDFILDPGKTSPKRAALFAINMLVGTRGGSNYSEQEYREWFSAAGLVNASRVSGEEEVLVAQR